MKNNNTLAIPYHIPLAFKGAKERKFYYVL